MPTLANLKARHSGICLNCGGIIGHPMHGLAGCPWPEHPLIAALIAKALEDEARIEDLNSKIVGLHGDREKFDCRYAGPYCEMSGIHCPFDDPCQRCQLDKEREAHEVTRKALEEADKAFLSMVEDVDRLRYSIGNDLLDENYSASQATIANHGAALARQEARKKEVKG